MIQITMVATSAPPTTPAIQTTPQQQYQEVSQKGTEIIIELGFEPDQLIAYHFIHVGTESLRGDRNTTVLTGQSIRWLLTRRTENKSYENITLRQLFKLVCKKHNLELEMEGDGPTYHYLDQSGITDYELLLRQCRSIGYTVQDKGNKLVVKPSGRPDFCGMVFDYESLINVKFTDKARGERKTWAGVGAYSTSSAIPAAETKTVIDRQSGKIEQQKKEDTTGTGKAQSPNSITGAIAPPITGNVKTDKSKTTSTPALDPSIIDNLINNLKVDTSKLTSDQIKRLNEAARNAADYTKADPEKREVKTVKNADGTSSEVTTITNKVTARGKISTQVEIKTKSGNTTTTQVVTTIETTKGTTIEIENISATNIITKSSTSNTRVSKEALDSLKLTDPLFVSAILPPSKPVTANPAALPNDPESGLPRQPIGAIAINEGKIEGQTLVVEHHRVRGYESTLQVITTPEVLTLLPGQIIGISGRVVPAPFDREWRISSVRHKFPGGVSDLQIYTPQAAKTPDNVSTFEKQGAIATPDKPAATVPTGPTNFIFPIPHGATTIGDGYGTRAKRPPSYRHKILDITAPAGTLAVAMADGVVTKVIPNAGGAGNMMTIQYADGYESTYMHGLPGGFLAKVGDAVKQGQPVFKIGSTGLSTGNHLHLQFLRNGQVCLLSQVGIDVLHMGLPIQRYNPGCSSY